MSRVFRDLTRHLVPSWLSTGDGGKLLHVVTMLCDISAQHVKDALLCRSPSYAGPSALVQLGIDRGILRGRAETREHYAARLINWRYPRGHRVRGSAFAVLNQVSEYWGGAVTHSYDASGNHYRYAGEDDATYELVGAWGDYISGHWGRFWIGIEDPDGLALRSDLDLDLDGSYGVSGAVADDWVAMKRLFAPEWSWSWKPAGTREQWIVLTVGFSWPSDMSWGPTWGSSDTPDGEYLPLRSTDFRYICLFPDSLNTITGDPELFPASSSNSGGTPSWSYSGDPDLFPTDVEGLGEIFNGDPDLFPVEVSLPDDGS